MTEEGFTGSRSNFIHWGQESFDQGSLLREFTRWDYELRNGEQVETVVDRALEMALGTPQGPVYLTLPREVLAQKMSSITIHPNRKAASRTFAAERRIDQAHGGNLARRQESADYHRPLGSDPTAMSAMVAFAEALVAPVVTPASPFVSLPNTHDFHLGVSSAPYIKDADVVVVVEADVPWYPLQGKPPENGKVIQIARDPNYWRHSDSQLSERYLHRRRSEAGVGVARTGIKKRAAKRKGFERARGTNPGRAQAPPRPDETKSWSTRATNGRSATLGSPIVSIKSAIKTRS